MGSSGTGSFGDLKSSGHTDTNRCLRNIESVRLEEVAQCEYYVNHNDVPPRGYEVQVRQGLHMGRIVVESVKTSEVIGLLPSTYSYLLMCMKLGHTYSGTVIFSNNGTVPNVTVTLNAQ